MNRKTHTLFTLLLPLMLLLLPLLAGCTQPPPPATPTPPPLATPPPTAQQMVTVVPDNTPDADADADTDTDTDADTDTNADADTDTADTDADADADADTDAADTDTDADADADADEPTVTPDDEDPATTPTPARDIPEPGGNLIMTLGLQDPPTLDPALVGDSTSAFVVLQLFSGLVRLDENLDIAPDLAEAWELSEDERTYTFTLRDNARFADGTPITSEDVRYSLERACDPDLASFLPARTYLGDIVGVRDKLDGTADEISGIDVIDSHTIALTIDQPRSYFLSKLVHPTSFVVDQHTVEDGGDRWTENPNTSGAFVIEQWTHDQTLILARNVNYHRDLARLDRVTFLMGAAASNPLVLYEQGKIDLTYVGGGVLARLQDPTNPLSQELVSEPQLSLFYIGMNVNIPPFDDPNVRQAFLLLIDRVRYAEVSNAGSVEPARGIIPPGMPGYNEDLPEPVADIERARELINESKYGSVEDLPPIVAYGDGVGLIRDVAEEELGLDIEVRDYETFGEFLTALKQGDLPMYGTGWIADYPDPENFVDLLFRSDSQENYSGYANPAVDELLDKAAVEEDEAQRWEYYQQAEALIMADAPVIPLYHQVEYLLVKPYVKGLHLTPMDIQDLSTVELVR